MDREYKGRFVLGTIQLLGEHDLEDGEEITFVIKERVKKKKDLEAFRASAGAWRGKVDAEELKRIIYESRYRGYETPPDP